MSKLTPMMQQYIDIKEDHKDCILFFRLGDFYEMFFDDAILASRELEITLTERGVGAVKKAPMCGIPHHVADTYIARLVEKGYKVAICEQLEDPKEAKGIVKRDVVRIVTPGTITDQNILDEKSNNYLAAVYLSELGIGISYVDNSTGEFYTTELYGEISSLNSFAINELSKIYPSEIICNDRFYSNKRLIKILKNNLNPYFNKFSDEINDVFYLNKVLSDSFENINIFKGEDLNLSNLATAKLLEYLSKTQKNTLDHINVLNRYEANNYMVMDFNTRVNLEIHETIISKDRKGSLVGFLDTTSTSMGGRLLKRWLEQPLINIEEIERRHNVVEYFIGDLIVKDKIKNLLKKVYDMERLAGKISTGNCNARDLSALKNSVEQIPSIKKMLMDTRHSGLLELNEKLDPLRDIYDLIDKSIVDNPPILITEGGMIKSGYNEELDDIRNISIKGKNWLKDLELKEREVSGINNLKIGFNKVHGYFFEVTKSNLSKVPEHFIRKQTLANSERYYTEELKSMENKILGSEERLLEKEYRIFIEIRDIVKKEVKRIQESSRILATLDVLNSFADTAYKADFIKPSMNNSGLISIKKGRHPVVESNLDNELFVANDSYLDLSDNMIQIITGPNMSGKSTYMRQVALITLLSHIGSFVPADYAEISIVDRIFTRIGAADNLSQGESTFMVEMNEVANIVKSATNRSLIILDEVGRGTSTYDGISIAWALVEYLAEEIRAKTLFATHYHELTELENRYKNIKNLTILAEEKGEDVIFLREVVKGSTNRSYGIQVARLAGVNDIIISRANEILAKIENKSSGTFSVAETKSSHDLNLQIDLMDLKRDVFIEKISDINPDELSPKAAHDILYKFKKEALKIRGDIDE